MSALIRIMSERWVMALALADGPEPPYPAPVFYALAEPGSIGRHAAPLLIFASSPTSHHGQLTGAGPTAAGAAVYLESETLGELRGAQLRGALVRADSLSAAGAAQLRARYLARHAIAQATLDRGAHQLYALIVTWAKLTDNRLGFGAHPELRFDARWSERRDPGGSSDEVEESPA